MTPSVTTKAILDKYNTLLFTPRPPIFKHRAPRRTAAGTPIALPNYVVLHAERGGRIEYATSLAIEPVSVRFEVYGPHELDVAAVMRGIMWDTGSPGARQGFDDALTLPLPADYRLNKMERTAPGEIVEEADVDGSGNLVFHGTLTYLAEILTTAA